MLAKFISPLRKVHDDEHGDNENLGRMLVLGLILIPIVILLTVFGGDIYKAAEEQWKKVIKADVTAG